MPREGQYSVASGTHYGGSPLWQRDRDAVRAINIGTRWRRGRPGIGQRWKILGYLVTVSAANQPYGQALRVRVNSVYHLSDRVCLVWRGGEMLGGQAIWLCGARTENFALLPDPPAGLPLCVVCAHTSGRLGLTVVNVNIGQVVIGGQD